MSSIYARLTLQNAKDIRLLSLYPAESPSEALRGELGVVNLVDSPEFEALSYTWGPPFENQVLEDDDIELSGEALKITGNLSHALRRLRLTERPLILWVDAICIDQSDHSERGHQVEFMADIFRSATCVFAWLGEDSESRDGSFFLQHLGNVETFLRESNLDGLELRDLLDSKPDSLGEPHPELRQKLRQTFENRKYFSRRWVIQEQAVARDILFICAESRLSYHTFDKALVQPSKILSLRGMYRFAMEEFRSGRENMIVRMLEKWQHTKCIDSRDIVLALASLWRHVELKVDYAMSTDEVYVALAVAIVNAAFKTRRLPDAEDAEEELADLLQVAAFQRSYHKDSRSSSLPSWVPDWRCYVPSNFRTPLNRVLHRAEVTAVNKLRITLRYLGEFHSIIDETGKTTNEYYWTSGKERFELTRSNGKPGASGYIERVRENGKLIDGSILFSAEATSSAVFKSLMLRPVEDEEHEYTIVALIDLTKVLPDESAVGYEERRITIV